MKIQQVFATHEEFRTYLSRIGFFKGLNSKDSADDSLIEEMTWEVIEMLVRRAHVNNGLFMRWFNNDEDPRDEANRDPFYTLHIYTSIVREYRYIGSERVHTMSTFTFTGEVIDPTCNEHSFSKSIRIHF